MKARYKYLQVLFLLCVTSSAIFGQTIDPDYVDGRVYVKVEDASSLVLAPYNNSNPAINLIFSTFGIDTTYKTFINQDPLVNKIYTLEFTNISAVTNLVSQLAALPDIDYAERVPYLETSETHFQPNDLQAQQWGLAKINAEMAWDITKGDSNIVIAIVDNAIQLDHEDLVNNLWVNPGEIPGNFLDDDLNGYVDDVNGYDVANFDNDPNPPVGSTNTSRWVHGTHCAGIASASTDNGIGMAGLGFNCRIMAVKSSLDQTDGSWVPRGFEGIDYAVAAGADVISMSWGGKGTSLTGERIVQLAVLRGAVLIAAAGNSDENVPNSPAAYTGVLSVGSSDQQDMKSGFSNFGPWVDVVAPGSDIFSSLAHTSNDTYGNLSGTSMATPLVAGLAGLVLSADPTLTAAEVLDAIKDGCDNIDAQNPNYIGMLGAGRVNAHATLTPFVSRDPALSEVSFSMTAYPNPFTDELRLRLESGGKGEIRVFDLTGREVRRGQISLKTNVLSWNTRDWARGLYVVEYQGENASGRLKVIKH